MSISVPGLDSRCLRRNSPLLLPSLLPRPSGRSFGIHRGSLRHAQGGTRHWPARKGCGHCLYQHLTNRDPSGRISSGSLHSRSRIARRQLASREGSVDRGRPRTSARTADEEARGSLLQKADAGEFRGSTRADSCLNGALGTTQGTPSPNSRHVSNLNCPMTR